MTTLENENQEKIHHCSEYSLRKWEERVFGTRYEEPKNFFPIAKTNNIVKCISQNKWKAVINAKSDN